MLSAPVRDPLRPASMLLPVGGHKGLAAALVFLIAAAPGLAFPSFLPATLQPYVVPICLPAAMLASILLLRDLRMFAPTLALFEIFVALAWWHMPVHDAAAVTHAAGMALGFLLMSTLANWCATRARLLTAATLFSLGACVVLVTGVLSAGWDTKLLVPGLTQHLKLGLPGLEDGAVNPNAVGGTAVLIAPVAFALLSVRKHAGPAQRAVAWATSIVGAAALAISGSRTAWTAAAVVFVGWVAARAARRFGALTGALLTAGGASLVIVAGWASLGTERVHALIASLRGPLQFRLDIWREAIRVLRASPWFGDGISQFRQLSLRSPEPFGVPFHPSHAHNTFLQVALDLGVPGLVAYLAVLVIVLALAWRAAGGPDRVVARLAVGAALSLIAVHAFGLTDAIALGAKVGAFQWASIGIIVAAFRMQTGALPPPASDAKSAPTRPRRSTCRGC
jgi:putative inorganic carbon (HCO3(-)) transporter